MTPTPSICTFSGKLIIWWSRVCGRLRIQWTYRGKRKRFITKDNAPEGSSDVSRHISPSNSNPSGKMCIECRIYKIHHKRKSIQNKLRYLWGNPRETFGPFIIICCKFSGPFERFLSEALAAFCASFLVTSLSPWASLKWTDRTDLVVKFAEQCSHLNPWAPFSTEWLAMCRFKLHCWKNPKQEK